MEVPASHDSKNYTHFLNTQWGAGAAIRVMPGLGRRSLNVFLLWGFKVSISYHCQSDSGGAQVQNTGQPTSRAMLGPGGQRLSVKGAGSFTFTC